MNPSRQPQPTPQHAMDMLTVHARDPREERTLVEIALCIEHWMESEFEEQEGK